MKDKVSVYQRILFPGVGTAGENDLYYHCEGAAVSSEHDILRGSVVDFHSYFNSFSCSKWKKYTTVGKVSLFLDMEGELEIEVFYNKYLYGRVIQTTLVRKQVLAEERQMVEIPVGKLEPMGDFSFRIQTLLRPAVLYGGFFGGREELIRNPVSLAVCFATCKRETYVCRNLAELEKISDVRIHTYVADNGNTLRLPASEKYDVVFNKNTGGAGGFARNMIRVMDDAGKYQFTHLLQMDDDVSVDSRVISRLADFLGYVKEEYRDSFVGGAMLRRDIPYFHVESGAVREGLGVKGFGYGLDLREPVNFMALDRIRESDHNGWWLCAIPMKYITKDNFPLPVFYQWDDVDYGIRNKNRLILLNGICTWHDAFDSRQTAVYSYYTTRNPIIVNACHDAAAKKQVLKMLKRKFFTEIYLNRYACAESILRGVEDFLKGPDWLCSMDAELYHKELQEADYRWETAEDVDLEWYHVCCHMRDCDWLHGLVRKLTFNGYLLPGKGEIRIVPCYSGNVVQGYRAERVLFYDEINGKGYFCERDRKRAKACYKRYRNLVRQLRKRYDKAATQYKAEYPQLISLKTWEKILFQEGKA